MNKHTRHLLADQRIAGTNSPRRLSLKTGSLAVLVLVCLLSVLGVAWATNSHRVHAANADQLAIVQQGVQVWNQWRQQNPTITPDLSGADLSEAKLSGIDLSNANLSNTDLNNSDLSNANLAGTNLNSSDLHGANARGANFTNSDLTGANLNNADLRGTGINKADVESKGATTVNADFGNQ
ncbi:MAG: pentapeptide repeat-containing protein [Chloroflexi bacterium]|nr:pentapeptide repeat-containing protein [Ktedonobacteraceae bacterium]MBV9022193.1 pentapeptide repeat-containing protein [Ktedonobacteraceae bacterium]MBV9706030.1 pentapeptide repeat-containing protein [Chloroflexota bacterium]